MNVDAIAHATRLVASFEEAALQAGELALAYFRPGEKTSAEITEKAGGSPVTEADYAVDTFLKARLVGLLPEAGWLSEESVDSESRLAKDLVLVVDPIDGTRGFAAGNRIWAIAIALIAQGRPVLGVVHAPALAETYVAVARGGARLNGEAIAVSPRARLDPEARLAGPSRLADDLRRAGLTFALQPRVPSLAMRIVQVASGVLDAGLASENSRDWDIAAADLILHEAGGCLSCLDGSAPIYNRRDTRHGVLTAAPAQIHAQINEAARRAIGRQIP